MDPDLILIFGFIVSISAVFGISVNSIVKKVHAQKRWEMERADRPNGGKHTVSSDRVGMIEDRLAVLERLATDRGQLLADEIEALRIENRPAQPKEGTEV